jgi:fatty acid desaturase
MARPTTRRPIEWPTLWVAAAIYVAWFALTWFYHDLPGWFVFPAAAVVIAWHGSLQHEVLHGHPTGRRVIDETIAWPPISLWLPYPIYRDSHVAHHRVATLTCPVSDPESYYVTAETWRRLGPIARALLRFNMTLVGRLLVGPALTLGRFVAIELRRVLAGDRARLAVWLGHGVALIPVLWWVIWVCDIPLSTYFAAIVYPGLSLTLLRSFAEHRPDRDPAGRTIVCEASWPLRLLFLNNNFHAEHHAHPTRPWYELPALARQRSVPTTYRAPGYVELLRRHLFTMRDQPVHPFAGR